MPTELDPIVGNWYTHLDKGQRFIVVDLDEDNGLVETQHFDGDLEEISLDNWYQQELEPAEEPENWSGALDISDKDDFGTEITDTDQSDWEEDMEDIRPAAAAEEEVGDYGEEE
jgi:hypothetical protein